VILATDGDFNVGVTDRASCAADRGEAQERRVPLGARLRHGQPQGRDDGELADSGNGNYSYIDSLREARKVLVSEAGATLVTIAKDVKIQVEFNPRRVARYRLIGYENRLLRARISTTTARTRARSARAHGDGALRGRARAAAARREGPGPLRYQQPLPLSPAATSDELLTLKLRYKEPEGDVSRLLTSTVASTRRRRAAPNGCALPRPWRRSACFSASPIIGARRPGRWCWSWPRSGGRATTAKATARSS
jgi:Ca-activated chloride channel family protein